MTIETTEWARSLKRNVPSAYIEAINLASRPVVEVILRHTDENGYWKWAIVYAGEEYPTGDFWMDAKDTKKEAVALCREMGWRIVK